ncbi:MAG: DUF3619 family protein [Azonexaceae bacterium]|nr:DUF3619 family protein [Azonexaceae bacterium]
MNEIQKAYRIKRALNHGLKDIPAPALRRLEAARHLALANQKQEAASVALIGAGMRTTAFSIPGQAPRIPYLKQIMAVTALLLGMWISFYWHSTQYVSELEEVDSALLADDLDPEALIDPDLLEWLKDDSSDDTSLE